MQTLQSDLRSALQIAVKTLSHLNLHPVVTLTTSVRPRVRSFRFPRIRTHSISSSSSSSFSSTQSTSASIANEEENKKETSKPLICTADELHYVSVPNTDWRLALWRYTPCPQAPRRNHPLLLLSGVGTNAIGFDLSPGASFARYMASQGFDTWILEVRGAGLSTRGDKAKAIEQSVNNGSISEAVESASGDVSFPVEQQQPTVNNSDLVKAETSARKGDGREMWTVWDESILVTRLTDVFINLSERFSGFLNDGQLRIMSAKLFDQISRLLEDSQLSERFNETREKISGLLEARQTSPVSSQLRDLSERLVNIIDESQRSVSPPLFDLQERLSTTIDNFQKQLELIADYDWDFDNYLEEDVPAAMEYIRAQTKPKDGRLLAIGHSMGGILLYSMLSRCGFSGTSSGLAAVVTLASSLDYSSSRSSLKLLLPLADPAQALNVPVIPLGALLTAAYPLTSRPPYVLAWLNDQISAQDMMHPELLKKLVFNNFCTIPAKLLLQLTTSFREGGLRNRDGTIFYKDHLDKSKVPVLALAGDKDLICPPEAVYETVKIFPEHLVTYKVFGEPDGPHYAHYDLVGSRWAIEQLYPCVVEFLSKHDTTCTD